MLYKIVNAEKKCIKGATIEQLCGLDVKVKGTPQGRIKSTVTFAIIC